MFRCAFFLSLILATGFCLDAFAQTGSGDDGEQPNPFGVDAMMVNLRLAQSSPSYMVTPGDVYTLVYAVGTTPVTFTIVVDAASRIRVANLGFVNGAGRTFAQVRTEVEALVARNHPLSGPQLILTQPAIFRVFVEGEVYEAGERPAWGLSRLSSLIDQTQPQAQTQTQPQTQTQTQTQFASLRNISVRSLDGQTRVFDLFRFQRFGEQDQNPYLRPGDVVTFNRADRIVTITGEVERPGTYQLLEGEDIRELVELYGSGFSHLADPSRMEVTRRVGSANIVGNRIFLVETDFENNFVLENHDEVFVPPISQLMPVVFVEGAVGLRDIEMDLVTTNRIIERFYVGETYAALARRNFDWFSAESDTRNAYVVRRSGEVIFLNLDDALFDATYRSDVLVLDGDTLIVPFRQFFVTVAGAVANPGRFPFIPDRGWEYYVALAGGFLSGRNIGNSVIISDINGRRQGRNDPITPETVITARSNHPMHYLGQYVVPVLTLVTTIVSIVLMAR